MSSITCHVINSLNNHPVAGLQAMLRCLSHRTTNDPRTFRGCTELDGEVHRWHSSDEFQSRRLDQFLMEIGGNISVWQICFDTGRFFGVENTCWPAVEVSFNLIPGKSSEPCQSYHVKLFIGPYGYETDLSLRPFVPAATEHDDHSGIQTPPATPIQPEINITPPTPGEAEVHTPPATPTSLDVQDPRVNLERGTSQVTAAKKTSQRQYLSEVQRNVLAAHYAFDQYPNVETVLQLSTFLGVRKTKIQSWFRTQRSRNGISKSKRDSGVTWPLNIPTAPDEKAMKSMETTERIERADTLQSMQSVESTKIAESTEIAEITKIAESTEIAETKEAKSNEIAETKETESNEIAENEITETNESVEVVEMADHLETSVGGTNDQPDTSVESMAQQLGNFTENIVDKLDIFQPLRYEQPNFHQEITYHEFDTFLDNSPDESIDLSSQCLKFSMGRSLSEPVSTTINPAELSLGITECCDEGKNTHVAVVHSASEAARDSTLEDPQVGHVSPYDTKRKGGPKKRKGTKRRCVTKGEH